MEDQGSQTAVGVLAARAVCTLAPESERILYDPFAAHFLPGRYRGLKYLARAGKSSPIPYYFTSYLTPFAGGAEVVGLRHRHIDDNLQNAYEQGIRQVVILGAGYDSRAHRLNYKDVNFVEIDHPLTQENKKKALKSLKDKQNKNVHYLSVDFMKDWVQEVKKSKLIKNKPTFVIWEGVSYYLNAEAIDHSLAAIKKLFKKGSLLIFDAYHEEMVNPNSLNPLFRITQLVVKRQKEPFIWGLNRDKMPDFLSARGFHSISTISMSEVADDLRKQNDIHISWSAYQKHLYLVKAKF